MTETPSWPEYLRRVTNGATNADISRATGVSPSTVGRWRNGETKPTTENLEKLSQRYPLKLDEAIKIVSAYRPPNAFVSFNLDNPLHRVVVRADVTRAHLLAFYSDLELAQEIVRRLESGVSVETGAPLPLADTDDTAKVTRVWPHVGGSLEDLPAAARTTDPDDGEDR